MEHIEVEAVDHIDLPTGVDAPSVVLYGGKGGVGKTTMAAATALASAAADTPTLVISTDPAHSLADTFERDIPPEPTRIDDDRPLYAAEIDPDAALTGDTPLGGLSDGEHPLAALFESGGLPGADEIAALQQLIRAIEDDRFDRVVVDTAPTGHTLRLLSLPEMMDSTIGRVLELRDRIGGLLDGVFSDATDGDPQTDLETLRSQIESVRSILRDPERSEFRIVLVPETMCVDESVRLLDQLDAAEITVQTIVVNRILEPASAVVDLPDDLGTVAPDTDSCEFCRRRWAVQRDGLADAQSLFQGRQVKRVPLLADDVRGGDALRIVARCLD